MQEKRANAAQSSRLGTMRNNTPRAPLPARHAYGSRIKHATTASAAHVTQRPHATFHKRTHATLHTKIDPLEKRALAAQSLLLGTMRNEHAHARPLPARHAYGSRIKHAPTASAAHVTQRPHATFHKRTHATLHTHSTR